ncbi:hypothetical protein L9F63_017658, partial [Diploptera punctata]
EEKTYMTLENGPKKNLRERRKTRYSAKSVRHGITNIAWVRKIAKNLIVDAA